VVLNGQDLDPAALRETGCPWPACEPPTSCASITRPDAAFPASLQRLLADQLDDLRRALQIRSGAA
jgi:hypothetical protein